MKQRNRGEYEARARQGGEAKCSATHKHTPGKQPLLVLHVQQAVPAHDHIKAALREVTREHIRHLKGDVVRRLLLLAGTERAAVWSLLVAVATG